MSGQTIRLTTKCKYNTVFRKAADLTTWAELDHCKPDYCGACGNTGRRALSAWRCQHRRALILLSDFVLPLIQWLMLGSVSQSELEHVLLELRSAAVKPTEFRMRSCWGTSAERCLMLKSASIGEEKKDKHWSPRAPYPHTATTYDRLKRC